MVTTNDVVQVQGPLRPDHTRYAHTRIITTRGHRRGGEK
jgi:hypothetical protein